MSDSGKLLPDKLRNRSPLLIPFISLVFFVSVVLIIVQGLFGSCPWKEFFGDSCPTQKFDYTLLTIRWPPGICTSTDCIDDYPQRWLIHGLWPNYANGSWPQFCCPSTPFEVGQVEPIRSRLESDWANLETGKDADSLWEHEWDKHGTCSTLDSKLRGQLNYFNYTLSLFNRIPVLKWLEDSNINPDNGRVYQYSQFYDAIHSKFQKRIVLQCHRSGSKTYLQQIEFCFDKITFEHRDCDIELNSASCNRGFLYTINS